MIYTIASGSYAIVLDGAQKSQHGMDRCVFDIVLDTDERIDTG
jgi:hypothetical protein